VRISSHAVECASHKSDWQPRVLRHPPDPLPGASTRRKWLSLLSSIQDDEVVIALQAHPVRST